jgi:hypothetical protein
MFTRERVTVLVALVLACLMSGCETQRATMLTIWSDSSVVGAEVLLDGKSAGRIVERQFSEVMVVKAGEVGWKWPGQVAGDTVFRANELRGFWTGDVPHGTRTIACKTFEGRVLQLDFRHPDRFMMAFASLQRGVFVSWALSS